MTAESGGREETLSRMKVVFSKSFRRDVGFMVFFSSSKGCLL